MSGKVAFCFPGQGSQEVGMGAAMVDAFPSARAVFDRARAALGVDLTEVCFRGPIERLSDTEVTQPALTATSLACLAAVREAGVEPDYVVGHSVGEYAALAASGAISDDDAMRLVQQRGIAMARAAREAPGAMAAVIGLEDAEVERLCASIEGVWPANYNCPGQLVVSGTESGVAALIEAATAAGARRAVRLKVSGGFHSPLTQAAERHFKPALDAVRFHEPVTPFLSTVTCRIENAKEMAPILLRQLTAPVRFTGAVETLAKKGAKTFVEVGSGNVLTGLVRRINRSAETISVSTPEGVEKLRGLRVVAQPDGRVTLVTGGSRGIGRAICLDLARAGARVGVNYAANAAAADEVVAAIREAGGEAVPLPGDIADAAQAAGLIEAVETAFADDLYNVVCNAGITRDNLISRIGEEDWDAVIDTNLGGTFHVARAATRRLLRKRRGAIVTMSSVVGLHGNPGQTNYAASKAGVIGLTKALAHEVGSRGIRVNCVAPGYIETELTAGLPEEWRGKLLERTPLQRLGTPEDVARVVRFLLSDDAGYITGAVVPVDGGMGM